MEEVTYTYGDDQWGDLLTAYDGKPIDYDAIGNPETYDGWTFAWKHGRELSAMSKNGTTWEYTYNANGLRTKRTNGTDTYNYIYNGSSLVMMTVGDNTLYFTYDASGSPLAVAFNGATYYYQTNLQGDITAILDSAGTAVVNYSYDAWGNLLFTGGTMANTLGTLNPLRYRGYVYDTETGLYYLQSRYYNPEWGRFINADERLNTTLGVLGFNMFSYCLNDPVSMTDYSGNKPGDLFDTADEAAKDAALYMYALGTFENSWEYATTIYAVETTVKTYVTITKTHRFLWWTWTSTTTKVVRSKKIQYTYKTVVTQKNPTAVIPPKAPLFKEPVATVHSHPYVEDYIYFRFSEQDINNAKIRGYPSYLYSADGRLRKYSPDDNSDIVIFYDLPVDPHLPLDRS